MNIDSKKLGEVAALMEDHGLTRVRLSEEDGRTVELERMAAPVAFETPSFASATPAVAVAPVEADVAPVAPAATAASGEIHVEAPMVGVFYAAPAPDAEPFVAVGSTVHAGDTLCIIEAMKLMNEVVAEHDGIITEICAQDGDLVEFGSCIMKIAQGGEE